MAAKVRNSNAQDVAYMLRAMGRISRVMPMLPLAVPGRGFEGAQLQRAERRQHTGGLRLAVLGNGS